MVGLLVVAAAAVAARFRPVARVRAAATALVALYAGEIVVGLANVWWLAPVPFQILHLLFADLIWIALVLLCLAALGVELVARPAPQTRAREGGM